ncbi:MAG TPA: zinc ribbon domain-containing protein, partial [Gemmatimonadales bacterium]|nr:zinc ribbon domain-containing protein [Gemmatimonadales bacterium]
MAATPSPTPVAGSCPACGAAASGRFCSACGASLSPRGCRHCGVTLSPQARFCHRCGEPVESAPPAARPAVADRRAWVVAAALCAVLIGGIVWRVVRDQPAPAIPQMANPGAGGAGTSDVPSGAAPDISKMSPRERFDRLFNRIMEAAQRGDSAQVLRFTPMALGAYTQLDTVDTDARYHAAVLRLQ